MAEAAYRRSSEVDLVAATARVYETLVAAAEHGRAVPSMSQTAALLRLPLKHVDVAYDRLGREGRITWRVVKTAGVPGSTLRVVTITASGKQTADAKAAAAAKRDAKLRTPQDLTVYQRALTRLQRRFAPVFSAEIVEGAAGKGFVWVGGQRVSQAQAIDMAGVS